MSEEFENIVAAIRKANRELEALKFALICEALIGLAKRVQSKEPTCH
jgi:hypothetical protein